MAIDIRLGDNVLDCIYNDLAPFLDQDVGRFVLSDFVECQCLLGAKAIMVKTTSGCKYYFTTSQPVAGQMTQTTFRGQNVLALPVATWQGQPVENNQHLHSLMLTCVR
jgi:hypothetical protein